MNLPEREVAEPVIPSKGYELPILRHSDHAPDVICRPAGYNLCEPLTVELVPDEVGFDWQDWWLRIHGDLDEGR